MSGKNFFARLLTERAQVFEKVRNRERMDLLIRESLLTLLFYSAIYGTVMGLYAGGFVILMDLIKVPLLLFLTLGISAPPFYVFCILFGLRTDLRQVFSLLSASYAASATVLLFLTPVVLIYSVSGTSHEHMHYVHYVIYGIAGLSGLYYLAFGMRQVYGRSGMHWLLALIAGGLFTLLVGGNLVLLLKPYLIYQTYFFDSPGLRI
jgi:hypothetical protein